MNKTQITSKKKRVKGFIIISFTYLFALICAIVTTIFMENSHPIIVAFVADVIATLVVYLVSLIFKNTSLYDPYWSIQPFFILIYYANSREIQDINLIRYIFVFILVTIWAVRLTLNWISYWDLSYEDWRYTRFRVKNPKIFWIINFAGLQMGPTVFVFVGCLSLYPTFSTGAANLGIFDVFGIIVTSLSIIIETIADIQMNKFKSGKENKGKIIRKGLWAHSRHPNYLGEILFWWGLYLFGISADPSYWWTIVGPITISLMFLFISIPMMEKHNLEKEQYKEYMENVPKLIPWFKRKKN